MHYLSVPKLLCLHHWNFGMHLTRISNDCNYLSMSVLKLYRGSKMGPCFFVYLSACTVHCVVCVIVCKSLDKLTTLRAIVSSSIEKHQRMPLSSQPPADFSISSLQSSNHASIYWTFSPTFYSVCTSTLFHTLWFLKSMRNMSLWPINVSMY